MEAAMEHSAVIFSDFEEVPRMIRSNMCLLQWREDHCKCEKRIRTGLQKRCVCSEASLDPGADTLYQHLNKKRFAALRRLFPRLNHQCRRYGDEICIFYSSDEVLVPPVVLNELQAALGNRIFDSYTIWSSKDRRDFVLVGNRFDRSYLAAFWGYGRRWDDYYADRFRDFEKKFNLRTERRAGVKKFAIEAAKGVGVALAAVAISGILIYGIAVLGGFGSEAPVLAQTQTEKLQWLPADNNTDFYAAASIEDIYFLFSGWATVQERLERLKPMLPSQWEAHPVFYNDCFSGFHVHNLKTGKIYKMSWACPPPSLEGYLVLRDVTQNYEY
jgi:hypothetical protein